MRKFSLIAAAFLAASPALAEEVTVFAAASTKSALDRFASAWQERTGHEVTISYAGSNQLARQIEAGAPADIFISAAPEWMDYVERAGLIAPGQRRDLLANRLVLVTHDALPPRAITADLDLAGLLGKGRLAMAMTDSVPAGKYGKQALQSLGLWESVANHLAQTDNVRAALRLVAIGAAPAGVVYATDALAEPGVSVLGVFPDGSFDTPIYPLGLLGTARDQADRDFFDALSGPEAAEIFTQAGFTVLE